MGGKTAFEGSPGRKLLIHRLRDGFVAVPNDEATQGRMAGCGRYRFVSAETVRTMLAEKPKQPHRGDFFGDVVNRRSLTLTTSPSPRVAMPAVGRAIPSVWLRVDPR